MRVAIIVHGVNPHATGDLAAEIICFSAIFSPTFREFCERIFTAVFCLAHYYRNLCVPVCVWVITYYIGARVSVLSVSEL